MNRQIDKWIKIDEWNNYDKTDVHLNRSDRQK